MADAEVRHRWTNDAARQLYETLQDQLRNVLQQRAVDLGISMADGDVQSAIELLRQNRARWTSDEHRAAAWEAWQRVIDPLVRRMSDLCLEHTVPEILIKTKTETA